MTPKAVVFDLDGVLLESEQVWNEAKRELVEERGGSWSEDAPRDMMGMSSPEWSAYLRDRLGLDMDGAAISDDVVARLEAIYREGLPWIEGAREAVERMAAAFPIGLASSSNREIMDLFLDLGGLVLLGEQSGLAEDPAYATFAADFRSLNALGIEISDSGDVLSTDARLLLRSGSTGVETSTSPAD